MQQSKTKTSFIQLSLTRYSTLKASLPEGKRSKKHVEALLYQLLLQVIEGYEQKYQSIDRNIDEEEKSHIDVSMYGKAKTPD